MESHPESGNGNDQNENNSSSESGNGRRRERPGYFIAGFCMGFYHKRARRYIVAPPGHPFPIWRKCEEAPEGTSLND